MIVIGEKLHYTTLKKILALLKEIMSKHDSNVFCPNCLLLFATENKRTFIKTMWK